MAGIFSVFDKMAPNQKDVSSVDHDVINSEMDDVALPEGAEMPDPLSLKAVADQVAVKVESSEVTTGPEIQEGDDKEDDGDDSAHGEDDHVTDTSPDDTRTEQGNPSYNRSSSPNDLGDDLLSVNTDINRHEEELQVVQKRITDIAKKIEVVPKLDDRIRKSETTLDDVLAQLKAISIAQKELAKSFNVYQTNTASAIASVERKAKERQLTTAPPVDIESMIPPEEIVMTRPEQDYTPDLPHPASEKAKGKLPVKVVDMSSW